MSELKMPSALFYYRNYFAPAVYARKSNSRLVLGKLELNEYQSKRVQFINDTVIMIQFKSSYSFNVLLRLIIVTTLMVVLVYFNWD